MWLGVYNSSLSTSKHMFAEKLKLQLPTQLWRNTYHHHHITPKNTTNEKHPSQWSILFRKCRCLIDLLLSSSPSCTKGKNSPLSQRVRSETRLLTWAEEPHQGTVLKCFLVHAQKQGVRKLHVNPAGYIQPRLSPLWVPGQQSCAYHSSQLRSENKMPGKFTPIHRPIHCCHLHSSLCLPKWNGQLVALCLTGRNPSEQSLIFPLPDFSLHNFPKCS